ncbi:MAG: hypothetical protein J6A83_01125 [Clostridia bacterium]|nr:hypothetical protein [Clostridia bacterium]
MKRTISMIILIATLTIAFSACGLGKVNIEDYEWKMRYVMHGEDNEVVVDAVGEYDAAHSEANIVELILTAKDGKITISDLTNNKTYDGTYAVEQKTHVGTDYKITIDGKEGYATVAMTTYADETEEPTLPINLGTYSIYFYAE